jgi:hypothetical protein
LTLSSGKIVINTANGLEVNSATGLAVKSGGDISVESGGDIKILAGGDISMRTDEYNSSKINFFYQTGTTARAEIAMDDSGIVLEINPDNSDNSGTPNKNLMIGQSATNQTWYNIVLHGQYVLSRDFAPYSTATYDLGSSSRRWDYIYASHTLNVADFFWLDSRKEGGEIIPVSDIDVIKAIQPLDEYDPHTGFQKINDASLPPWLVHHHVKPGEIRNDAGEVVQTWAAGDVACDPAGKPYLSTTTMVSLLMGAVRELDAKIINAKGEPSAKT